jgi:DNA-binding response OmpR family regulator
MKQCSTILVVDDDASVRSMLVRVLEEEGYQALSAANGAEGVALARSLPIDLVLLDLSLPVKSGWDTFEDLVAIKPLLPVIVVTACSNQWFTAVGAGVGALLEKPLDFPQLLRVVHELLTEPIETRRNRLQGRLTSFRYVPTAHPYAS